MKRDERRAVPGRLTVIDFRDGRVAGRRRCDGGEMVDARRLQVTRPLGATFDRMAAPGCEFNWTWGRRGTLEIDRKMNRLAQAVRWRMSRAPDPEEDSHDEEQA
jgi:hypothetical protein